jgi:hypothetical protein
MFRNPAIATRILVTLFFLLVFLFGVCGFASAQYYPGMVVREAGLTATKNVLDPDRATVSKVINGTTYSFVSRTNAGYSGNDDVGLPSPFPTPTSGANELPFRPIYPYANEPYGDLRRGPDHRFSDYVPSPIDRASYYMYYDGTNILFRMRMGGIVPGAKGFSFLVDIDGKFGNSGANADPNFVAATTGVGGNPGFEVEVDLFTQSGGQTGISVYNVDGLDSRGSFTQGYNVNTWTDYSQISMAATADNGDPDYYIDFYIPFTALSNLTFTNIASITTATQLRIIPTTVMAPLPAIGGPKSDIYGLDDDLYKDPNAEYMVLMGVMPSYSMTQFASGGTGTSATLCTSAPVLNSVSTGSVTVTGMWTKANAPTSASSATISLYKNGSASALATLTATSGVAFSFTAVQVGTVVAGDYFTAKALGTSESACYTSSRSTATACIAANRPVTPVLACTSGVKGTSAANKPSLLFNASTNNVTYSTVWVNNTTFSSTDNQATNAGTINTQLFTPAETGTAPNVTWTYSAGCSGSSNLQEGNYKFWIVDQNACQSDPVFYCANVSNRLASATALTAPTLTSPTSITASTKSITGSAQSGTTVSLYINGIFQSTATTTGTFSIATTGTFTFTSLTFATGDQVRFTSERNTGTNSTSYCGSTSSQFAVTCYATPPVITTSNTTGLLTAGSPITGASSEVSGSTIKVYNNAGNLLLATTAVLTDGSWTTSGATFSNGFTGNAVAGTTYYATATAGTCTSANSSTAAAPSSVTSARCATNAGAATMTITSATDADASVTSTAGGNLSITAFTTSLSGSLASAVASTTVTLYEDGISLGSVVTATNSWTISSLSLYFGNGSTTGLLTVGVQGSGLGEQVCGTSYPVVCTGVNTPSITFSSCTSCGGSINTITSSSTVTYTIGSIQNNAYYALREASTGAGLSNSQTATSTSNLTMTTSALTGTGSHSVEAVATLISTRNGVTTSCSASSLSSYTVLPVAISGTVYDDANNSAAGTFTGIFTTGEAGTNAGGTLYVYLDSAGYLVDKATVASNGTYTLANGRDNQTYSLYLSTQNVTVTTTRALNTLTTTAPTGYVLTTPATRSNVATVSTDLTGYDFGLNQVPVATTTSISNLYNPGGTTSVSVASSNFGTDADGTIASITKISFPTGATSLTLGTVTYYPNGTTLPGVCPTASCLNFPASGGVTIPASTSISVDPSSTGVTTVTIPYNVTDNGGATSTSSGTLTLNFVSAAISGNVYNDYNGTTNSLIDGTAIATASATALYVNLVNNATGLVVAVKTVTAGSPGYSFSASDNVTNTATYKLVLSTTQGTIGASAPAAALPTGWVNTAEGVSAGSGDGTGNGSYLFSAAITAAQTIDFGIEALPTASSNAAASQLNPGSTNTVTVPAATFSGTDAVDVSGGIISYVHITSLPTNTTSITIIGATTAGGTVTTTTYGTGFTTFPAGGVYIATNSNGNLTNPSAVAVDPTDGAVTVSITYKVIDNAGQESTASATASQPLATASISGTVYNDNNGLTDALINGTGSNNGSTLYVNAISGGVVTGSSLVASNGTYSITGLNGGAYTLVLTTSAAATTAALPAVLVNTGEGSGTTSDGSVNGSMSATISTTDLTGRNFGYDRLATADAKLYSMAPNNNPLITAVVAASTNNASNSYAARIGLTGSSSSGATPGALTGTDADGNNGATLSLGSQVANNSLVIDPTTYAGLRRGASYSNAMMLTYNGIQLEVGGCKGSDIGNSNCALYNATTAKWEIPAYDMTQLKMLVKNGTSSYSFQYAWKDAAGFTGSPSSYDVAFQQALPLKLDQFTASPRGTNNALLEWNTLDEQNTASFNIEHSITGQDFRTVGTKAASGYAATASYSFLHTNLAPGVHYYRLKMIDIDGSFTYSPIRNVSVGATADGSISLAPNPAAGHACRLSWTGGSSAVTAIQIFDAYGRVVLTSSVRNNNSYIISTTGWASGTYQVLVQAGQNIYSKMLSVP